jgi:hypothetical protein
VSGDPHGGEAISRRAGRLAADRPRLQIADRPSGGHRVKSVTFVSAAARAAGSATGQDAALGAAAVGTDPAGGWRPQTWLGAPAPGGLALPSAQPTPAWLYAPRGVYLGDVLVVADTGNHRVLIWHQPPERDEQPCDVVLGQPDAFSDGPAAGRGDSRIGLHLPTGVLMDGSRLVVADAWHHRVLVYDRLPEAPGATPDLILGQPDPDSVAPNAGGDCRPSTMYWPFGIAVVGGRFYVADTGNRRVLGWSGGLPTSPDTPPDLILGQPDGFGRAENRGAPAGPDSFRWPHGIAGTGATADTGMAAGQPGAAGRAARFPGLLVADAGNHRVLGWATRPDRDTPADLVLGQPDFTAAAELPYGPQRADMLRFPYAIDSDGAALAVADTANNRVLLWDRLADSPAGPPATAVLGQPGFGPNGENHWTGVTRDSLCWPYGLSLAGDRLAVADSGNNRVVIWRRQ